MEKRHIVYGIVFIAVFTMGSLNVMTDGRFSHLLSSQLPGHSAEASATPEIEIENNLSLGNNETGEIRGVVRNADEVSYSYYGDDRSPLLKPNFNPPSSGGQDSLPPTWLWDHPEKEIEFSISFNSSELDESQKLGIEASNIDSETVRRNFSVNIS